MSFSAIVEHMELNKLLLKGFPKQLMESQFVMLKIAFDDTCCYVCNGYNNEKSLHGTVVSR